MIYCKFKEGVVLSEWNDEYEHMIHAVSEAWPAKTGFPVVTAGVDGKHMSNSLHYASQALDFRINSLSLGAVRLVYEKVKQLLGEDYDVVLEKDHIHIEHDPKEAK